MTIRRRPGWIPVLFSLIVLNALLSGFFDVYWIKDNRWRVEPRDLSIRWLSDADYRRIENIPPGQAVTLGDGRRLEARPDDYLSYFQVGSPDGHWHASVAAGAAVHKLDSWMITGVPALLLGLIGLLVSLSDLKPNPKEPVKSGWPAED